MTISVAIPSDLQAFIEQEVATGAAANEQELVVRALHLYQEMRSRHAALVADVQESIAQADRGETATLDIEETIARGTDRLASEGITD